MKRRNRLGWMMSWGLAAVSCFSACSSDNDEAVPLADRTVVKTQFAFSLPGKYMPSRMTSNIVQQNDNFRGVSNIYIYPIETTAKLGTAPDQEFTVDVNARQTGTLINTNSHTSLPGYDQDFTRTGVNDVWYNDIEILSGTNSFLVYGEATKVAGKTDVETNRENGVLNMKPGCEDNFQALEFQLQPIVSDDATKQNITADANRFLSMLNGLLDVKGKVGTVTVPVAWRNVSPEMDVNLYVLYEQFIGTSAGSARSLLAAIQRLYNQLKVQPGATADTESLTYQLIDYMKTNASVKFDVSPEGVLSYQTPTDFEIPSNYHLPDGAMSLQFKVMSAGVGQFVYVEDGTNGVTPLNLLTYPASLRYFTNTSLFALPKMHEDLQITPGNWEALMAAYKGAPGVLEAVDRTTRSIVLRHPLEYGVGLLKTSVQLKEMSLKDNNPNGAQSISIPAEGLPLTGIMIGRQRNVDWAFHPLKDMNISGKQIYTMYDNQILTDNKVVNGVAKTVCYTLVTESIGPKESPDKIAEEVPVVLEFENTAADFYGVKHKLIAKGTRFYLLGNLTIHAGVTEENRVERVFMQDYETEANFTINALRNAYNVIPDLRNPELELGLAVDISWNDGLDIDVDMDEN